ncbi:MAG: cytochrome c [Nitrospirae bacterium]|nr:cytochrome c [Nitrospirota bacterium]
MIMIILRIITCLTELTVIASVVYGGERVLMRSRVPDDQLSEISSIKNPLPHNADNIEKGKIIYVGKGRCILCHGASGDGKGLAGILPDSQPSPRNFRNPEWQKTRTDGELKWVITFGVPGSLMLGHRAEMANDEEIWQVIHYIRSFGQR